MTSSSDRRALRVAAAIALAWALAAGAATARAQGAAAPGDPKEMARHLGEEALGLHQQGRFREAFEKLERAERIAHSPVFVLWMARGKRATGELLLARRLYDQVAAEALPPDASPNWIKATADARAEREALAARIPRLEVRITPPAPPDARIEIDGAPMREGTRVELDPGEHVVRVSAANARPVERRVRLEEGSSPPPLEIALDAAPPALQPVAGSAGSVLPGAITLGVGALAVTGGGVLGGYALVLAGEVNDGCIGERCQRADEGKAGDADTLARVSTGLLIGGAVVVVTGVVLLLVRPGGSSGEARAAVQVGPGSARAALTF